MVTCNNFIITNRKYRKCNKLHLGQQQVSGKNNNDIEIGFAM